VWTGWRVYPPPQKAALKYNVIRTGTLSESGNSDLTQFVKNHPCDTVSSSGLRFLTEVIAWVAGPWAVSLYSNWLVVPVIVLLVGLPSIFSTTNDKNTVIVPTSGGVRVFIELLLYLVAAVSPWLVWSNPVAAGATGIVIATIFAGLPRMRWLLRGAPL